LGTLGRKSAGISYVGKQKTTRNPFFACNSFGDGCGGNLWEKFVELKEKEDICKK
jgi:hypothetical protein